MEEETTPLKGLEDNSFNYKQAINDDDSPSFNPISPQDLSLQQSEIKLQLLQCLRSVETDYDEIVSSNQRESQVNKELLLEEAEMVRKLQEWIEQKGKTAIKNVSMLQSKCDEYEQKTKSLNMEIKALHDELEHVNKEKAEIQTKYDTLHSDHTQLQHTVETLQIEYHLNADKQDENLIDEDKVKVFKAEIIQLNEAKAALRTEIEHMMDINRAMEEQNNALKTKIGQQEIEIKVFGNIKSVFYSVFHRFL